MILFIFDLRTFEFDCSVLAKWIWSILGVNLKSTFLCKMLLEWINSIQWLCLLIHSKVMPALRFGILCFAFYAQNAQLVHVYFSFWFCCCLLAVAGSYRLFLFFYSPSCGHFWFPFLVMQLHCNHFFISFAKISITCSAILIR